MTLKSKIQQNLNHPDKINGINQFDNWVFRELMNRYGHIDDMDQLKAALSKDGLGDLMNQLDQNSELVDSFIEEHREEIDQSIKKYTGSGVMPVEENVWAQELVESDSFPFDPQACLLRCNGECCTGRNYLMIVFSDILKIVNSPIASYLNIHSTIDLYDHHPPYIELFFNEEYDLYLPYLRYLPIGTDLDPPPEKAENSICPFLYPIDEIFSLYDLSMPQNVSQDAMGCILMENKPLVCKLSPVSQSRGMETGRITYRYVQPIKNCPGCQTHKEIKLSNYLRDINLSSEEPSRTLFHSMVMTHHTWPKTDEDKNRFNSILLEFYNIDQLLSAHGQGPEKRSKDRHLMKVLIDAARGDFSLYDRFINRLSSFQKSQFKYKEGAMAKDFFNKILDQISKFQYSIAPFLENTTRIHVYDHFFEFDNFYYSDWEKQDLNNAKGLCQHLSIITHQYLTKLTIGSRRFIDYFDIYFASSVFESKFFTWPASSHICLMLFKKGSTDKCWVLDPCFKFLARCYKEKNTSGNVTFSDDIFTTRTEHKYIIPAAMGSTIRETLEISEGALTNFSASSDTFIPLFIYENKSLILANIQVQKRKIKVQYYEHKAGQNFSQKTLIHFNSQKFNTLNQYNNVFSLLNSLRKKVTQIKKSDLDQHQRLVSSELEEENMPILYSIESIIVQTYKTNNRLTDSIVANLLKALINKSENKPFTMNVMNPQEKELHTEMFEDITLYFSISNPPKRIRINALKRY
ncbi:MAG: hypothetical protein OMM_03119 [Candidatus Magnetoglobus multicellularis str. Araruama]|uniref:Uncharacterized protein n=1 Tax=Candidatus Magnetoglobus multicellularis str. Araruama TaxID=890399 RepID=A0A1V1P707_9BACT|nr:MAG: hypothetical protein OMM_03119 [Candidatus Magnetoglobus multicellularis str. Araruama]